jgi:spore coat protein A, manganese oxidase
VIGLDPDAPFPAPDGDPLQGYVCHCHMLDHEDNVMMRRTRIVDAAAQQNPVPMPDMDMDMDMPGVDMPGHHHQVCQTAIELNLSDG